MAILLDLGACRILWATTFVCLRSMRGDGNDRLKGKRADLQQTVRVVYRVVRSAAAGAAVNDTGTPLLQRVRSAGPVSVSAR